MANAFAHIELSTTNVKHAKKFYASVFDWKFQDLPDANYTMVHPGEGAGGGIQPIGMEGQPAAWLPYVQVASVKSTLGKAKKAGAKIVQPFLDIGDMGAIGVFLDPTGAALGVWETKKAAAKKAAAKKPAAKKPAAKKAPAKKATKR